MKIKSSLKSIKKRDLNSKFVEGEEWFMSLIKQIQNLKQDKIVLWITRTIKKPGIILQNSFLGNCRCCNRFVLMALFLL